MLKWANAHLVLIEVEEGQAAQEFCTGMLGVQVLQLSEDCGPHMQLLCGILETWYGLAHFVGTSQITNVPPPIFVCLISVAWVVLCQVCSKPHDLSIVHFFQALRNTPLRQSPRLPLALHLCNACKVKRRHTV